MKLQPTEHQIMNAIIGYLRAKGFYCQRLNAGKYAVGEGRFRRYIQGVEVGTPDILAFKGGCIHHYEDHAHLLFVEVKRPKGKTTIHQDMKMNELEQYGARCVIAHSVEELEALGI